MYLQPNKDGVVYSYYGIWDVKKKPKTGVHVYMLDEHIKRKVEIERENFNREIAKTIDNFKKEVAKILKKNSEEIKSIHLSINELTQFIGKVMEANELKQPEIEKKVKPKYVKNKKGEHSKKKREPEDDGYL